MTQLKGLQGLRALKLAAAFGHHWAGVVTEAEAMEGIDVDEIERLGPVMGLIGPDVETYPGCVFHATATGRLEWLVIPDGQAEFTVHRPDGPVLEAWVDPEGNLEFGDMFLGAARKRHVDILAEAIHAIAPHVDVVGALRKHVDACPHLFDEAAELAADIEEVLGRHISCARLVNTRLEATVTHAHGRWSVGGVKLVGDIWQAEDGQNPSGGEGLVEGWQQAQALLQRAQAFIVR